MAEPSPQSRRDPRLLVAANVGAIVAISLIVWAIFSRAFVNYDTLYAMIWGRDAFSGRLPDYEVTLAPTPHPLLELVGGIASLFGNDAGYTIMLALAMLSFGALVWGVFLLGRQCFNWPVGAIAALVVASRIPYLSYGMRAYVDIPFLALIVFAALLEVRKPRRGVAVLVLLGLAGLLRPEAWALSGVYLIYLWPALKEHDQRAGAIALVLAAPFLWAVSDLIVTGNALHSLTATQDTAATLNRPRGIVKVFTVGPRRIGEILRVVALGGSVIGLVLSLIYLRSRALVPAALVALGGLAFLAIGVAGLPLLGRYLFMPATMLAIFFGAACFGWISLRERPKPRRNWMIFGIVLAVVFISSTIAHQTPKVREARNSIATKGRIQDDLRTLAQSSGAKPPLRDCRTIYVPNHRPVPILAWYTERQPEVFRSGPPGKSATGALLIPANENVSKNFVLDPNDPVQVNVPLTPPSGWQQVAANRYWRLYTRGC